MATTRRLAETDLAQRRPERALDGTVLAYRGQILRHLRAQSLDRHAELFAEPVTVGETIRWQTDLPGEPRPYAAYDRADQDRLRHLVGTLITELRNEAERLSDAGSDAQRRLAEVLDRATRGIEWKDIWVLTEPPPEGGEKRERIVLAGWGLIAAEGRPPVPDLLGSSLAAPAERQPERNATPAVATQTAPPPEPQSESADTISAKPPPTPVRVGHPSPWPLRLLALSAVLLLFAGLLAWQLPALAGVLLGFRLPEPPPCEALPGSALPDLQREETRLRFRLAELERAYAGRAIQCRIARAPPPPPPPPPRSNPDVERAERAGAPRGALQVILAWEDINDLDLYILCPDGQIMGGRNGRSACGGTIDIDANHGGGGPSSTATTTPIETAHWDRPAAGTYRVGVNLCCTPAARIPAGSAFRVTIRQAGLPDRTVTGFANRLGPDGRPSQFVTEVVVP